MPRIFDDDGKYIPHRRVFRKRSPEEKVDEIRELFACIVGFVGFVLLILCLAALWAMFG